MKIIKRTEYKVLGRRLFENEWYLAFRSREYNDLILLKQCKLVSRDGVEVSIVRISDEGKISHEYTPYYASLQTIPKDHDLVNSKVTFL